MDDLGREHIFTGRLHVFALYETNSWVICKTNSPLVFSLVNFYKISK